MICPYCDMRVSNNAVDKNDGCCPHCGTKLDHVCLDDEEEEDLHEDDVEDYEERFGHPTRSYENRDIFDEFLDEEDDLANGSISDDDL